ncbi:MAG: hypothetical protein QOI38_2146 [Sphingomonadales bacterium]|jgi:hypothetical protein|nr:hypothetical protein [Sphingomonadales bacterium]
MPKACHLHAVMLAAAGLAACRSERPQGPPPPRPVVVIEAAEGWRSAALPQHAGVTEDMPGLFRQLAAAARAAGADRELLDPYLALPRAAPAPGPYRCRLVRLGPAAAAPRGRRGGREAFCFVTLVGDRLSLTLETAARPLGGFLWETSEPGRLVFLGAEFRPGGRTALPYGEAGAISTAGLFERIGDFRYRLVVRGPQQGTADVYELIAAPNPR